MPERSADRHWSINSPSLQGGCRGGDEEAVGPLDTGHAVTYETQRESRVFKVRGLRRNLAKNLHDFADDVSKVLRDIKGMAGEDAILTWAGKTAESFTSEFEDAPGKLKKLKKSYEMAGDALSTYWPELERAQALADKALVKGREAQGDLSSAQTRLTSADSWMDKAGKEADKYKDDKDSGKDVPKPDPDKVPPPDLDLRLGRRRPAHRGRDAGQRRMALSL
jgi:uncharacterized protein YukE